MKLGHGEAFGEAFVLEESFDQSCDLSFHERPWPASGAVKEAGRSVLEGFVRKTSAAESGSKIKMGGLYSEDRRSCLRIMRASLATECERSVCGSLYNI